MNWLESRINDCIYIHDFKDTISTDEIFKKLKILDDQTEIDSIMSGEEIEIEIFGNFLKPSKATYYEPAEGGYMEDMEVYYNDIDISELLNDSLWERFNDALCEALPSKHDFY